MKARLWRGLLAWRFRLFQRHRHRRLVLERVLGRDYVVLPDVFNPGLFPTGAFLAEQLAGLIPAGAHVLDMGTGAGIGAISAAQVADKVTALDINPEAVRCTRINVLLQRLEDKICVQQSNLFAAVTDERFDVVLFNPPYFRGRAEAHYDHAWRSEDTVERFAAQLGDHLTPAGFALVVLSTNGDSPAFLQAFAAAGFSIEAIAAHDLISEVVTVYQLNREGTACGDMKA